MFFEIARRITGKWPRMPNEPERRAALIEAVSDCRKLHLACGKNVLPGWVNIDIDNGRNVYGWDLRYPFPINAGTIDIIFAEHFIEHLTLEEGEALMRECHRILVIGGVVRLSTPDLSFLLSQYAAGRIDEWADLGWTPASRCKMVNEGMRLWGHQFLYDKEELRAMLKRAGFETVREVPWRDSTLPDLRGIESRPFHDELIVEAVRAA